MDKNIQLALMTGIEIPLKEFSLVAHSPTIKEIALMGESNFFMAMQYLCIDKSSFNQGETVLFNLNNFQILMKVLEQSENKNKKQAIQTLLMLLFPGSQIMIMPKSINIVFEEQIVMIDEMNFDNFQSVIKDILCANNVLQGKNIVYKPKGKKAKKIADKLMKNRQKIAQQKAKEEGDSSILIRYLSILRIGPRIPLSESIEYNLFQLFDQIERYNAYTEWEIDLKVKLAGGSSDKQVETWMRNLHSVK